MCQFAAAIRATDQAPRHTPAEYHPLVAHSDRIKEPSHPNGVPGKRHPCPGCGVEQPPTNQLLCAPCTEIYRIFNSHPDATPTAHQEVA
jgi:hypothetical protein